MGKLLSAYTRTACLILSLILPGLPLEAYAQAITSAGAMDGAGLEALFDPIFAEQMSKLHIPGAVVAVVKDGKILFTKGYGYANLEKKNPVIPDKTIFRIGSITKVFTATALMQLAERRRISLNTDVNKYLRDFKVPSTYRQPITFANLLTHTSGLDEISPGRRTDDESRVIPLGTFLKSRIVRLQPPGEVISYSTYNAALAGFLVEQMTGTPFKDYLRQNIFEPLRMDHTSIATLPPELKPDLATGYEYAEGSLQQLKFQWFNTYPASDINSIATDMARFMMMNLAAGALDGKRILSVRGALEMQRTHFRNHPSVPGWCYGFYEEEQNGLRIVEHGGSMDDGYSALLSLVPEKNLGLFVACNTETGGFGLAGAVKNALLNHYFPARNKSAAAVQTIKASRASLERFAGKYMPYIYCHTCAPGSGAYVPDLVEVKINDDGTLSFQNERWRRIGPLLFQLASGESAGKALLAFRQSADGKITYMFQETYRTYQRVPG